MQLISGERVTNVQRRLIFLKKTMSWGRVESDRSGEGDGSEMPDSETDHCQTPESRRKLEESGQISERVQEGVGTTIQAAEESLKLAPLEGYRGCRN